MAKRKALVIASYPAPYRVAVFDRLSDFYDLTIYFDTDTNENRNMDWFARGNNDFYVLNNQAAKEKFRKDLLYINRFDFVLPYDSARKPAIKAIFMCKIRNIPYFINCDGAIVKSNAIRDRIKRFLFSGGAGFFSSGESATNYFLKYGVDRKKIHEHHFTSLYETDFLNNILTNQQKKSIREKLGLQDRVTFLSVGQFIPRKGFDILLRAWGEAKLHDAQLIIIGGGNEKENYLSIINELSLDNVYLLDFMNKDAIFRYYDASDVFILPTREDIWGLVINEAMARGLPVVSTDRCMAGVEMIDEGQGGYIIPAESIAQMAFCISEIAQNPELRERMGKYNLQKEKGKTVTDIAESHYKCIERALFKQ